MSTFTAKLRIASMSDPQHGQELELLVDTGAGYSWISRQRLEALGIRPSDRMQFQTIEGRLIEREVAPVAMAFNGRIGGDTVVIAEPGDMEVWGAHALETLGLAADPVRGRLVRAVGLALRAEQAPRRRQIVRAIDEALRLGRLREPFSNVDFRHACPGFGEGTYNAFPWKHRKGNGRTTELFELVAPNQFKRVR